MFSSGVKSSPRGFGGDEPAPGRHHRRPSGAVRASVAVLRACWISRLESRRVTGEPPAYRIQESWHGFVHHNIYIYIYNMPSNLMQLYPVHSVDTGQDCMSYPDRLLSTRLSERFTSLFSTVDSLTDRRSFSAWSWDCGFATQSNRPALLGITKLL